MLDACDWKTSLSEKSSVCRTSIDAVVDEEHDGALQVVTIATNNTSQCFTQQR